MQDKYIDSITKKIEYNSFIIRCLYFDISVIFAEHGLLYSEHDVYNVSRNGLSSFFNSEYLSLLDKVSRLIDHNIFLKDTLDFVNKMPDDHDHRLFVIYAFAFFSHDVGRIVDKSSCHHFLFFIDLILQFSDSKELTQYRVDVMFLNNYYFVSITKSRGFSVAYNDFIHEDFSMPLYSRRKYNLDKFHVYDYLLTKPDDYQENFFNRLKMVDADISEFYSYKEEYTLNLLIVDDNIPVQDFSF